MTIRARQLAAAALLLLGQSALGNTDNLSPASGAVPRTDMPEAAEPTPSWYQRHAEGWFWRDVDPELQEPEAENEPRPATLPSSLYPALNEPLDDPLERLEQLQKAVEIAKARAVLQPTDQNVLAYIKVQHELMEKSGLFADVTQRLIWRNPEYDYGQVRPTSPVALQAYSESFKADRRAALREIAQEYGLYFVISGACPYCHAMAPYLKRFAESYGFTVIAVTVDGGSVAEFPDAMYSPAFAEQLNVKITPAIILARPSEGVIQPIAYGFVDLKELETRIYRLFRQEPGKPTYQIQQTRISP